MVIPALSSYLENTERSEDSELKDPKEIIEEMAERVKAELQQKDTSSTTVLEDIRLQIEKGEDDVSKEQGIKRTRERLQLHPRACMCSPSSRVNPCTCTHACSSSNRKGGL